MYPNNQNQQPQGYQPPEQPPAVGGSQPPFPPQQPTPTAPPQQYPPQQPVQPQQYPPQAPTFEQPQSTWAQPAPQPQPQPQPYNDQPPLVPEGVASIDYLDQISAKPKGVIGFTRKQLALFGGLLLLAFGVFIVVMLNNTSGPNITQMSQKLIVRSQGLSKVAEQSKANIQNQSLGNTNSAIQVQLTSAVSSLTKSFDDAGVSVKKPSESIVAAESNAKVLEKLEDARLSGTFDRIYITEMSYQLETTILLINDIHARTNNSELKNQLKSVYDSLKPLHKQLGDLSSSIN